MPVADLDDAVDLTLAYISEVEAIAEITGITVRSVFVELAHTNRGDIAEFIDLAEPWVKAGADEGADLAAAYISEMAGVDLTAANLTAPAPTWEGPFHRTWHQLSEGMPYAEAKDSGASVAEMLGHDATMDGASQRMRQPGTKVRGYRRVISAKACEWCRVVSTQMYASEASATFGHHGCKCQVVAVPHGPDAAQAINQARLRELKASGAVERVSKARERSRAREAEAYARSLGVL
jgi:hypothetical protein